MKTRQEIKEDIIKRYAHAIKHGTSKECARLVRDAKLYGLTLEELNVKARALNTSMEVRKND